MGWRLREHVERHAPATVTHREKLVLSILAGQAFEDTRVCAPYTDPDIQLRASVSRSQLYAVVKALVAKGALELVTRGQKHVCAKYRISTFGVGLAADSQRPGFPEAEDAAPDSQRPEIREAEDGSGSRNRGLSVPDSGTRPHLPIKTPHHPRANQQRPLIPAAVPGEGEGSTTQQDPQVDPLVAAAAATLAATGGSRLTGAQSARLRMDLRGALVQGWTAAELQADMSRSLSGTNSPSAALLSRARTRAQDSPATESRPAARPLPDWCGECDESTRFRDRDDGMVSRCPVCHPNNSTRQEATA